MFLAALLVALGSTSVRAEPVEAPSFASPAPPAPAHQQQRVITLPGQAYAYVPATAVLSSSKGAPLLVLLHGADHRPAWMLKLLAAEADRRGIVLLAPTSRGQTWDSVATAAALPS